MHADDCLTSCFYTLAHASHCIKRLGQLVCERLCTVMNCNHATQCMSSLWKLEAMTEQHACINLGLPVQLLQGSEAVRPRRHWLQTHGGPQLHSRMHP